MFPLCIDLPTREDANYYVRFGAHRIVCHSYNECCTVWDQTHS